MVATVVVVVVVVVVVESLCPPTAFWPWKNARIEGFPVRKPLGLGFKVQGLGLRVQGLGFRV